MLLDFLGGSGRFLSEMAPADAGGRRACDQDGGLFSIAKFSKPR